MTSQPAVTRSTEKRTAIRRAYIPCAALALLVTGCTADLSFQSRWGEGGPGACSRCAQTEPAPAADKAGKPKPPTTFPDAFHKYIDCLCWRLSGGGDPPAPNGNGKENGNGKDKKDDNGKQDTDEKKDDKEAKDETPGWYSAHAQATIVSQVHNVFRSPYVGPNTTPFVGANSLLPNQPSALSETGTLFLDARLWQCGSNTGELVFNPEIAGGSGFSQSSGIADFPNGEITRVGLVQPTPYIARLFVRNTIGLGGEQEKIEDGPNLIAGTRDVNRVTLTVGKFSATDLMDDNRYSHDPRTQFLPWGIIYNGAWDYPANVRGYTYGVGIDYNTKDWALRYAVLAEPKVANGAALDEHIDNANGHVLEWEGRYALNEHPGHLRLLAYLNHAHMGNYGNATREMPVSPDVTATRAYRLKYGFGVSWDQELTRDLGVFGRLGWNDGHSEDWAFTAIDRIAELGLSLKGRCWCRPKDTVGLAFAMCGLAHDHHEYLAAGGLDFIIGDGRLNYAPEETVEVYYNLELIKGIQTSLDFQEVIHPAYNADRGPVSIGSLRVHFEF